MDEKVTTVALLGEVPAQARPFLAEHVEEPVVFEPVADPTDEARVREVFERSTVVVGPWPACAPAAAPRVRLVQQTGAGIDGYDRAEIPDGAFLCNVYGHDHPVAEHVFLLLLALRRDLLGLDRRLREGQWAEPDYLGAVDDIRGSRLGIVGFGGIGRALVEPARGFGMEVIAHRHREPDDSPPDGVTFVHGEAGFDRLLATADAIVLSVPLNEDTRGLIGREELTAMSEDALLINVSRGEVVDQKALYEGLSDGEVAGAGIDTWYRYPSGDRGTEPADYPFWELGNVVMTPHIAGWSRATAEHRWAFIASNVDRIARGERPKNVVWEPSADD